MPMIIKPTMKVKMMMESHFPCKILISQENKQVHKLKMLVLLNLYHNNHKSSVLTGPLLTQVILSLEVLPKG